MRQLVTYYCHFFKREEYRLNFEHRSIMNWSAGKFILGLNFKESQAFGTLMRGSSEININKNNIPFVFNKLK